MSKGTDTRTAILDEALDLASEVGLEGLTIGDLARRVDMSKSGLYAHFQSKEALQLAVLDAAAESFTRLVIEPAVKAPRGRPRIEAIFDRWVTWSSEAYSGGCPFIAAATEYDDQEGLVRECLVRYLQDALDFIRTATRLTVEQGDFRQDLDVENFVFEFWGIMLAFHNLSRLMRQSDAREQARASFNRLLNTSAA